MFCFLPDRINIFRPSFDMIIKLVSWPTSFNAFSTNISFLLKDCAPNLVTKLDLNITNPCPEVRIMIRILRNAGTRIDLLDIVFWICPKPTDLPKSNDNCDSSDCSSERCPKSHSRESMHAAFLLCKYKMRGVSGARQVVQMIHGTIRAKLTMQAACKAIWQFGEYETKHSVPYFDIKEMKC